MALAAAITDLEQLEDHPALAGLLAWNRAAVESVKFDRGELTVWIDRTLICEACETLRRAEFSFLCDITCVDWHPSEPRFEVVYHLLSMSRKERVRLKVKLESSDPVVESLTAGWPGANYFEREIFDLFGVRFSGHPNLLRILMPDDWKGHPLRKDYPVEGYR